MRKVLLLLVFALLGCNNDTGGGGADFDATLYYTKAETNSLLESYYTKAQTDPLLADVVREGSDSQAISGVGWAGKTAGFTVPTGATSVLVKVSGYNSTGGDLVIGVTLSETEALTQNVIAHYTAAAGQYYSVLGYVTVTGATTVYAWHNTGLAGAASALTGITINVQPVLWFK
jgi:hypothetical protein